jgi:hypothetical protein
VSTKLKNQSSPKNKDISIKQEYMSIAKVNPIQTAFPLDFKQSQ